MISDFDIDCLDKRTYSTFLMNNGRHIGLIIIAFNNT